MTQITRWLRGDWIPRLFYALYIAVAVATFRHTAFGFASIEGGSIWLGALSALAVDAGMILSASGLRHNPRNASLLIGLVVSAVASTYAQLLFSVSNAAHVDVALGAQWMTDAARSIIDWRVVVLPALLPALAVVYAFAAKTNGPQVNAGTAFVCDVCGATFAKQQGLAAHSRKHRKG